MPIAINGSGTLTGLSVGGLEDGIITPAELSTGGPGWDAQSNLTNVASINAGPLAGMRNAIINGNFDIWQRGTSFAVTTSNTYTSDRWELAFDGTGATRTLSRQTFELGQTNVPGEPTYFARFVQSVAGSGATFNQFDQRIEDVRTFAGRQVTVSFWAKAAASTTMPNVVVQQLFGSSGSPSPVTSSTAASNIALTTTWQQFSYQVSIPSISGKTLGTDNNSTLILVLSVPLNTTFTIDIAQVQVEPGPVATPFERRPIGTELSLCQRYFCTLRTTVRGYVDAGPAAFANHAYYPVTMRVVPTVTMTSTVAERVNVNASYPLASNETTGGYTVTIISTGSSQESYDNGRLWTASAEL